MTAASPSLSHTSTDPSHSLNRLYGVPDGAQPQAIRHALAQGAPHCLFVTHHDRGLKQFSESVPFFLGDVPVISFPAWDTLPYDRSSPSRGLVASRVAALNRIEELHTRKQPFVVATTANALLQKLPPRQTFSGRRWELASGKRLEHDAFVHFLSEQGYRRASKVMEPGEFAVRGSIIDIYPGDAEMPVRLDLFGDEIESIRPFDPLTQRSSNEETSLRLSATSELILTDERIRQFRRNYRELFGQPGKHDSLYQTVSEGHHHPGMEHWLPLFYERMETLTDYLPQTRLCLDHGLLATLHDRQELIRDYYQARLSALEHRAKTDTSPPYHPVPPEQAFITGDIEAWLARRDASLLETFSAPQPDSQQDLGLRPAQPPHIRAKSEKRTPFEIVLSESATEGKPVLIAAQSEGSGQRLTQQLEQQLSITPATLTSWEALSAARPGLYLTPAPIPRSFTGPLGVIYSEQDLLGRQVMQIRKRRHPSEAFMAEASAFDPDELLVHKDHGIGRFDGLETLEVAGRRHDCLKLVYKDEDKLFVPVENMDLISRHGSSGEECELDKLGAGHWQARKAAYKEKLRLTAEELLSIAAKRELTETTPLTPQQERYSDFVARFPYEETEDQDKAIAEVIDDLQDSKPMDRLICGDVGFGKTEVALRAAFIAATDPETPKQVAFIAPTTLLVRQHYHTFRERFAEMGLEVAQLSRLCSQKETKRVKEGLADGTIDVVIGTHALLADSVTFDRLGFVIIDEEQRFGVKQKEKLKSLKGDMHVLTMSATPIPRTLQMSLAGVRELSLITTPPVDRLAIRSFVTPFDPVVIQEALNRELHRGGQVFYVTPRIQDLPELKAKILEMAPQARLAIAHGQMAAGELDKVMNDVYEGKYDILLSTAIIESGIDIPNANTMIIHRADRFGLAQLYQLRGRVGRGKVRAYAYFTLPYHGAMSTQAVKRLEVMQSLDSLGAGFTLASHDMDIRGFGNLVGEEQSGHVKDIGVELYQQMLADAVKDARTARKEGRESEALPEPEDWSPQLNLGLSVMIPQDYVEDLSLRLSLYRRAATLENPEDIESFAAELADRFGPVPEEAEHLFTTLKLKQTCRAAGVARVDTGPKGVVLTFREEAIRNPQALLGFIHRHSATMKLRADQSLFYQASWADDRKKLSDIRQLIENIAALQQAS